MWDLIVLIPDHCLSFYFSNDSLNVHKDFDDAFADAFPDVAAHGRCRIEEDSYRNEKIAFCDTEFEDIGYDVLKQSSGGKKRKNTRYNKKYKKKQDSAFKAKEILSQREYKQTARQDPAFKAIEIPSQCKSKQNARQDPAFKADLSSSQV